MIPCEHDWRIVNTRVDPTRSDINNPILDLKCRRCGSTSQVFGKRALKAVVNQKGRR